MFGTEQPGHKKADNKPKVQKNGPSYMSDRARLMCKDNNLAEILSYAIKQNVLQPQGNIEAIERKISEEAYAESIKQKERIAYEQYLAEKAKMDKDFADAEALYRFLHPGIMLPAVRSVKHSAEEDTTKIKELAVKAYADPDFSPADILQYLSSEPEKYSYLKHAIPPEHLKNRRMRDFPETTEAAILNQLLAGTLNMLLESERRCFDKSPYNNEVYDEKSLRNGYYPRRIMSAYGCLNILYPRDRKGRFESFFIRSNMLRLHMSEPALLSLYICRNRAEVREVLMFIIRNAKQLNDTEDKGKLFIFTDQLSEELFSMLCRFRTAELPERCVIAAPVRLPLLFSKTQRSVFTAREAEGELNVWYAALCITADGRHSVVGPFTDIKPMQCTDAEDRAEMLQQQVNREILRLAEHMKIRNLKYPEYICLPHEFDITEDLRTIFPQAVLTSDVIKQQHNCYSIYHSDPEQPGRDTEEFANRGASLPPALSEILSLTHPGNNSICRNYSENAIRQIMAAEEAAEKEAKLSVMKNNALSKLVDSLKF